MAKSIGSPRMKANGKLNPSILRILLILFLCLSVLGAADQPQPHLQKPTPIRLGRGVAQNNPNSSSAELPTAKIITAAGIIKIGNVAIDPKKREISLPCRINMSEGLLEYALVASWGKRHESLLTTNVHPYDVQIALLLLGLKNGPELSSQGDPGKPQGDPVELSIRWIDGETVRTMRIEQLIFNKKTNQSMQDTDWIFTGSRIMQGVFMSQVEGSLIALFHDPSALIDNPSPGGEDDTIWYANSKIVPPNGTLVMLDVLAKN